MIAARLSENLGQQFIVDNRAGANGTIGSNSVAKSPVDGYTLLLQASTFVAAPLLMNNVPYDIEKDFTPITNLGAVPLLVTRQPRRSGKELQGVHERDQEQSRRSTSSALPRSGRRAILRRRRSSTTASSIL